MSSFPWPDGTTDRRRRALLLHAPRTGGSAIRAGLDLIEDRKHVPLAEQERRHDLTDRYVIAFTRNPYTRAESLFRWAYRRRRHRDQVCTATFRWWLELGCPRADGQPSIIYRHTPYATPVAAPQVVYLGTEHDFRGRFETIHEDFLRLAQQLGAWWAELPVKDRSGLEPLHDDHTRELVREMYREDFEAYGYEE